MNVESRIQNNGRMDLIKVTEAEADVYDGSGWKLARFSDGLLTGFFFSLYMPYQEDLQAAADAAQRERMRAAMGEQDGQRTGKTPPDGAVVQAETAEQRERRQAVEAWLKRVPDEPGALLKAKFRLEHERRQKEGQ